MSKQKVKRKKKNAPTILIFKTEESNHFKMGYVWFYEVFSIQLGHIVKTITAQFQNERKNIFLLFSD